MFNYAFTEKREKKLKQHWEDEIVSLTAHEAILETKITEKQAEIDAASVSAVKDIHKSTKEKLLETLIKTVKKRHHCEVYLVKWYTL